MIWTHPGMTNWLPQRGGQVVNTRPSRIVDYRTRLAASRLDDHVVR